MAIPRGGAEVARQFARAVLRRKWADLLPLFTADLRSQKTVDDLATEFGWKHLLPRLKQMFSDRSGEAIENLPDLDPPKRFEAFEMDEGQREPPPGWDTSIPFGWIEVDFYPSDDSEFDNCYNCFLAIMDEGGPRVASYGIEPAND